MVAQTHLSALEVARRESTDALGDLDRLRQQGVAETASGTGSNAESDAVDAAIATASAIVERQNRILGALDRQ